MQNTVNSNTSDELRVRFAPSPTGNVHIGNIRAAVLNWLFARANDGKFLLRIEDTDKERSTPEAISNLLGVMEWLGLRYDEEPVYQSNQLREHIRSAEHLKEQGQACETNDGSSAVLFRVTKNLYDPDFVTDPGDEASIDCSKATALQGDPINFTIVRQSRKSGKEFRDVFPWDAIEDGLTFHLTDGSEVPGENILKQVKDTAPANPQEGHNLNTFVESEIQHVSYNQRKVFFNDLILGYREKPLEDLKDFVIVRSDGSPVFHLANVVDDINMTVTHILRGNDHTENTFRHLFLFKALGQHPPAYGHLPMIVNDQGKPYSKRDGDAYVGDFQQKGFLPEALFNFLALCGWSPGDDREKMTKAEMIEAFSLKGVSASPAQFDRQKLEWLNSQYLMEKPDDELEQLFKEQARIAGWAPETYDRAWWTQLVRAVKERIRTLSEFSEKTHFFFEDEVLPDLNNKKVRKVLRKEGVSEVLRTLRQRMEEIEWHAENIEEMVNEVAEGLNTDMGKVAQPLRVAATGGVVSPGIGETVFLIGREKILNRIDTTLEHIQTTQSTNTSEGN